MLRFHKLYQAIQQDGIGAGVQKISNHPIVRRARDRYRITLVKMRARHGRSKIPVQGSTMYVDVADPGIGRELILTGTHEPRTTAIMREELQPGMVVLDVGSNIGYYALLESQLVGEHGCVYAVEPVPQNFSLLCKNIALNKRTNIQSYCFAISDTIGTASFAVTSASNWGSMVNIQSEEISGYMKEKMTTIQQDTIAVPTKTIDQFVTEQKLTRVNLIRMDIEGYEIEALRGARNTLQQMPRPLKLLIEVHNKHFSDPRRALGPTFEHLIDLGFKPKIMIAKKDFWRDIEPKKFVDLLCSYTTICCHVLLER